MTEEIKKAFEEATTDEERKAVLDKYKDTIRTLSEEELEDITGGVILIYAKGDKSQTLPGIFQIN